MKSRYMHTDTPEIARIHGTLAISTCKHSITDTVHISNVFFITPYLYISLWVYAQTITLSLWVYAQTITLSLWVYAQTITLCYSI
jgi:hypothetical protein